MKNLPTKQELIQAAFQVSNQGMPPEINCNKANFLRPDASYSHPNERHYTSVPRNWS